MRLHPSFRRMIFSQNNSFVNKWGSVYLADLALTDGEEELIAIPMAESERISFLRFTS